MDKNMKNQLIKTILNQSGITDEKLKQEFLDKYIDSDIRLKDIERNLDYYKKKDLKKQKNKLEIKKSSEAEESKQDIKYTLYKYNNLSVRVKEDVSITLLENKKYGTNGVLHVLINEKDKAYLKSSKVKYIDDIDASISQFAKFFDIEVTDIYKVEDNNGGNGIISYDIRKDDNLKYVSLYDAYMNYYNTYKQGKIPNLKWMMELLSLPKSSKEMPLTNEEEIKIVIDMGMNILKDQFNMTEENAKKLKIDYLKILVFDYITNQTDRSLNNVNLIIDGDKIRFAPLYDNGCVYNEDIGSDNIYLLDHICSRDSFIKAIFKYYYDDIDDYLKQYINKKNYIEKTQDVLKNNLSEDNYKWYYKKLNNNINRVIDLYDKHKKLEQVEITEYKQVDLSLQYGYVKTFTLLLSVLLVLLVFIIIVGVFV